MHFLRFGSSIPGDYWGCCACCIIQNFKCDPDAKASIEMVSGDGGGPITFGYGSKGQSGSMFAGKTYREIFETRLRVGTFSTDDMPNHAFIAIITDWQVNDTYGQKWLAILKEHGFEFIRSQSNSVYTGQSLGEPTKSGSNINYIFGLFRNIGQGGIKDPFSPPKGWTDLPSVKPELCTDIDVGKGYFEDLNVRQSVADKEVWKRLGKPKFYSLAELEAETIPVTMAGRRSDKPQEPKSSRDAKEKAKTTKANPFAQAA